MRQLFDLEEVKKDLKPFGVFVRDMIDQGMNARSWLTPRWERLESMYRMEPGSSGVKELLKGVQIHPTALVPSRCDTIRRNVVSSFVGAQPWVSAVPDKHDQSRADELEEGFQTILEKNDFEHFLGRALKITTIKAQCPVKVCMNEDGYQHDVIDPNDFVISPTYGATIAKCDLAAHRTYIPGWEVKRRQDAKEWFEFEVTGNSRPEDNRSQSETAEVDYSLVQVWDAVVRVMTKAGPKLWRVFYAYDESEVCHVEEYPYSRPWYSNITFSNEYQEWWSGDSPAYRLQGYQHDHTTMSSLRIQASMMGAIPPIIVSGGALSTKLKNYVIGTVLETTSPIQAQSLPISININEIPGIIDQIEREADAVLGTTQNSTGQESGPDTTATETAILNEAAQVSRNDYTGNSARGIEDMVSFMQELAVKHPQTLRKVYGECLKPNFFNSLKTSVRWVMTGKRPDASPSVMIGKAMALVQMSENPNSTLDYAKCEKFALETMRLPVEIESLEKTNDQPSQGLAPEQPLQVPQGAMVGSPGDALGAGYEGGIEPVPSSVPPYES